MIDREAVQEAWERLEPEDLPGDLQWIAYVDMGLAQRLCDLHSGRLYVPGDSTLRDAGVLTEAGELAGDAPEPAEWPGDLQWIAPEDIRLAVYLAMEWAGTSVYVPSVESVVQPIRDRRIRDARPLSPGDVVQLARRWGLTRERVRSIAKTEEEHHD
jgi:hypothetical protein